MQKKKTPIIATDGTQQKATLTSAIHATTEIPSGLGEVPYRTRQPGGPHQKESAVAYELLATQARQKSCHVYRTTPVN